MSWLFGGPKKSAAAPAAPAPAPAAPSYGPPGGQVPHVSGERRAAPAAANVTADPGLVQRYSQAIDAARKACANDEREIGLAQQQGRAAMEKKDQMAVNSIKLKLGRLMKNREHHMQQIAQYEQLIDDITNAREVAQSKADLVLAKGVVVAAGADGAADSAQELVDELKQGREEIEGVHSAFAGIVGDLSGPAAAMNDAELFGLEEAAPAAAAAAPWGMGAGAGAAAYAGGGGAAYAPAGAGAGWQPASGAGVGTAPLAAHRAPAAAAAAPDEADPFGQQLAGAY